MKEGDKIRVKGQGGNESVITVGLAFDAATIERRLKSGEWTLVQPKRRPRKAADTDSSSTDGE